MKTTLKKSVLLGLSLALLAGAATAQAQEGQAQEGKPAKSYVLEDGTVHDTPGEMFQYLRTRDNGLAAGNPRDIVDAYPEQTESVGNLIHQKRVTD